MLNFNHFVTQDCSKLTRQRSGEEKLGQRVRYLNSDNASELLSDNKRRFVILGIPEDIGVRANLGRRGAHTAFLPALESFLNQQSNFFLSGDEIIIAGALNVEDLMREAEHLNPRISSDLKILRELTGEVDKRLSLVIEQLIIASKIPIIIGGGHNNAYGNIKGASMASAAPVNVVNCDPHSDFRQLEGRHSGNGFSYAFQEGFLNQYAILALHEQYNNVNALRAFQQNSKQLFYQSFESIFIREELSFKEAVLRCVGFVKNDLCGIELDLDSVSNVPTSAKTSSGLTALQARQFIYLAAQNLNCLYLHIAEGAPVLAHKKADNKTGKLIAYMITDFMKAVLSKTKKEA